MVMRKLLAGALTAGMMLSFIPATAMAANKGWVEDDQGWRYYVSDTEYLRETWKEIDGSWYYFLDDGVMICDDWAFIGGKLYHFDKRGHMEKNKWVDCGKKVIGHDDDWNPIYDSKLSEWRYVGSDGAAYAGWKKINGSWYHFIDDDTGYPYRHGLMLTGMQWIGNGLYCIDDNGKMLSNTWYQDKNGYWYFISSDGRAASGWKKINGKWYLFNDYTYYTNGMSVGATLNWEDDDSQTCWMLNDNGALTSKTGFVQSRDSWSKDKNVKCWYYVKSGGQCVTHDWVKSSGKWYYFDIYGVMVADKKNVLINDRLYDFDSNGACLNPDSGRKVTGWVEFCEDYSKVYGWAYGDKNGNIYKEKWLTYGGSKYYFDSDGCMYYKENECLIDGKPYSFDEDGKATDLAGGKTGWIDTADGKVYVGSDGKAYTGWNQISGKWYYFSEYDGTVHTGLWEIDRAFYAFRENGEMVTGWYEYNGNWYYADKNGKLYADKWLNYRGSWYYFSEWAVMSDTYHFVVKGYGYNFDGSGKCLNPDKPFAVVIGKY